jgi:hypothetical protein
MDGDGKLDIVSPADGVSYRAVVLRGVGNGTFNFGSQIYTSPFSDALGVGDLNGDGSPDIVTTVTSDHQVFVSGTISTEILTVTTAVDEDDGSPNLSLGTGASLREILKYAQTLNGPQTIVFHPDLTGKTINLTINGDTSIGNSALQVSKVVTIQGPASGSGITLSGGAARRMFMVTTTGDLTLNHLTLMNGTGQWGGAIYDNGKLKMNGCTLTGNTAISSGGAIFIGGGLSQTGVLVNCTLTGNQSAQGGAIGNGRNLTLVHVTICKNTTTSASFGCVGGLYAGSGSTTTLTNTIIAGNTYRYLPSDVFAAVPLQSSSGYNLIGSGGSGGLKDGVNGNIVLAYDAQWGDVDIRLGNLADNGGPTKTMALLPGSIAIELGVAVPGVNQDQRGNPRTIGKSPDIGAPLTVNCVCLH